MISDWFSQLKPTDLANLATGAGTIVLAGVAAYQGYVARRQIELGDKQADAAKVQAKAARAQALIARRQADLAAASVETAIEVHRESVRARADQYAPRIVAYYDAPKLPRIGQARSHDPRVGNLRPLHPKSLRESVLASGQEFILPENEHTYLWFWGSGELTNEGQTSAHVRLSGGAEFNYEDIHLEIGVNYALPPSGDDPIYERVIPPGGKATFRWAAGKTVGEWVEGSLAWSKPHPNASIWLWIESRDPREVGVLDTLMAHFSPNVLVGVDGRDGHWKVGNPEGFGAMNPLPIKRSYIHEGEALADLSQMYEYFGVDKNGKPLEASA